MRKCSKKLILIIHSTLTLRKILQVILDCAVAIANCTRGWMEKERENNNYPVEELLLCNGAAVFSQRLVNPFSTLLCVVVRSATTRCNSSFSTTSYFFSQLGKIALFAKCSRVETTKHENNITDKRNF